MREESSQCDDTLFPNKKIIVDRGGVASLKENVCQVSTSNITNIRVVRGLQSGAVV
jgi:hypothetical protein